MCFLSFGASSALASVSAPRRNSDYLLALTLPDSSTFQGEFDTGATLQHVFLRVRRNAEIRLYDINMYSSGFTGDGSETIKALCRRLFALAGYADYNDVIYGTCNQMGTSGI